MDESTVGRWEVWRQDDNGNRYLVSAHDDEAGARRRLADLESGVVHKQMYWMVHDHDRDLTGSAPPG